LDENIAYTSILKVWFIKESFCSEIVTGKELCTTPTDRNTWASGKITNATGKADSPINSQFTMESGKTMNSVDMGLWLKFRGTVMRATGRQINSTDLAVKSGPTATTTKVLHFSKR
jgi:hypothetical protein